MTGYAFHPEARVAASASTINGGFASSGRNDHRGRRTLKLSIIAEENAVAVTAIHPGEHLAGELKELDMSAAELARKIGVPTNRVTAILNGQRAITGATALRLAHFFGTSAEFWLNLQSLYELRLARQKVGKSIKALPTLKRPEHIHA
jgi:antitoxin HigA-1